MLNKKEIKEKVVGVFDMVEFLKIEQFKDQIMILSK